MILKGQSNSQMSGKLEEPDKAGHGEKTQCKMIRLAFWIAIVVILLKASVCLSFAWGPGSAQTLIFVGL